MPKYRYLTDEELNHLEKELKQFLIVNYVYDAEWKELNQSAPDKALELIALFSDQVLHRVYEKITYLEKRSREACFVFKFDQEQVQALIMQSSAEQLDLSTPENIHKALTTQLSALKFYKSSKAVKQTKEQEIHQLIEQGAVLSSADFWNELEKLYK